MHIVLRFITVALLMFMAASSNARQLDEQELLTLGKAINLVSKIYQIPRPVMYALYLQEGGWPGARIDVEGSADLGVFQINTHEDNWLPILKREIGLSEEAVQNSIVGNTMAAGYILSIEFNRTNSWVQAMGNYHRHKKDAAREQYIASVTNHLLALKDAQERMQILQQLMSDRYVQQSLARETAGVNFR